MTPLRKEWLLVTLLLVQPGCFSSGSHDGNDDSPRILPGLFRPRGDGYSTIPPNKDKDGQEAQDAKTNKDAPKAKDSEATTPKADQAQTGAEPLPLPLPPPTVVSEEVTVKSLTGPPGESAQSGPPDRTVGPGKIPALVTSLPLSSPVPLPPGAGAIDDRPGASGREPLEIALGYLLADRHEEFMEQLKKYNDPTTQKLFERVLPALALLAHKKVGDLNPAEVSKIYEPLQALLQDLRSRTRLTIENACFCDKVNSFGDYQPCAEGHVFQASSSARPGDPMHVYAEVRNFASLPRDGLYETHLTSSLKITEVKNGPNGQKKTIWSYAFNEERQHSRSPRTDHFNHYKFNVPAMPPGEYLLTITIADETTPEAHREPAVRSLLFRVGTRQ